MRIYKDIDLDYGRNQPIIDEYKRRKAEEDRLKKIAEEESRRNTAYIYRAADTPVEEKEPEKSAVDAFITKLNTQDFLSEE